jgi:hypothetical protein
MFKTEKEVVLLCRGMIWTSSGKGWHPSIDSAYFHLAYSAAIFCFYL